MHFNRLKKKPKGVAGSNFRIQLSNCNCLKEMFTKCYLRDINKITIASSAQKFETKNFSN